MSREVRDLSPSSARRDTACLLARVREGDGEAFGRLLESHWPIIYYALWRRGVKSAATADDLGQETALAAWTNISRLKDPRAFSRWLQAIAVNCARDHLRRLASRREKAAIEDALEIADPDDLGRRLELLAETRLMLTALSGEEEDSLRLLVARASGCSANELATRFGLTPDAVRMRTMRSRKRLRRRLDRLRKGNTSPACSRRALRSVLARILVSRDSEICDDTAPQLAQLFGGKPPTACLRSSSREEEHT